MKKEMSFESAIDRLSKINAEIESGDLSLDKSLELFKEGIELTKFCQDKLNDAKKQVELLKKE